MSLNSGAFRLNLKTLFSFPLLGIASRCAEQLYPQLRFACKELFTLDASGVIRKYKIVNYKIER